MKVRAKKIPTGTYRIVRVNGKVIFIKLKNN